MLDVDALSEMMAGIISEEIEKAVAPLNARIAELESRPAGPQMDDVKGVVEIMISDAFVVKSARETETPELPDFAPMIEDAVGKAVGALPKPKDGEPGKAAAGIVEALKDSGELVLTLEDGRLIRTGIRDGERGKDGFELTDYDEWFEDDGRTLVRRFVVGEDFKEFRHQTVLPRYRSIFKDGETYNRGDLVTWGGHLFHCDEETTAKPDDKAKGGPWSIAARRGRDGKNAQ